MIFEIDVFLVLPKEELPNKCTSENLESVRFKILLSMFRILFMRINLSSEKKRTAKEVIRSYLNINSIVAISI